MRKLLHNHFYKGHDRNLTETEAAQILEILEQDKMVIAAYEVFKGLRGPDFLGNMTWQEFEEEYGKYFIPKGTLFSRIVLGAPKDSMILMVSKQ